MKKEELLYSYLLDRITYITESEKSEEFAETLNEANLDLFISLIDQLKIEKGNLESCRAKDEVYPNFLNFFNLVDTNDALLQELIPASLVQLKLNLLLGKEISGNIANIDNNDIDENKFQLLELGNISEQSYYHFCNTSQIANSIIWINLFKKLNDKLLVPSYKDNVDLLFYLLFLVQNTEIKLNQSYLMIKNSPEINNVNASAVVKLHLLSDGRMLHEPKRTSKQVYDMAKAHIDSKLNYCQFEEIFIILSEYNSRKEILNKFISIYHVIENFMFKFPIATLEHKKNGDMFSIRDFRRLYKAVDITEQKALEDFLKVSLELNVGGKSLNETFFAKFLDLPNTTSLSEPDMDKIMGKFDFKNNCYSTIKANPAQNLNSFSSTFSLLIYRLRNSIVHNKETEYHLSSLNINDKLVCFLSEYMLPQLEELVFTLICIKNDYVWYNNQHINLFTN